MLTQKSINILKQRSFSISTAESCTCGELARLLTSVSGSSRYFSGGIIAYQTQQKINILKVKPETIAKYSVVSEETAQEMSKSCQMIFNTEISISTTGVAGPEKGEDGKKVGTLFYSIRILDNQYSRLLYLPNLERNEFVQQASRKILDYLSILLQKL